MTNYNLVINPVSEETIKGFTLRICRYLLDNYVAVIFRSGDRLFMIEGAIAFWGWEGDRLFGYSINYSPYPSPNP